MDNNKLTFKIKVKRTSRNATKDGFNGYGKYRSNSNLPYGYCNKFQKQIGIYFIRNKENGCIYIGASTNIGSRISKHFSDLKKQKHPNHKLLNDYNKYGIDCFEFGILEICEYNKLKDKEREYQIKYDINSLYNLEISHVLRSDKQISSVKNQDKTNHKTKEYRQKMKTLKENKIGQFDKYSHKLIKIYNNSDEVCNEFDIAKSTLLGCCNGSKKSAKGFIWHYLDENNNVIAEGKGKNRTIMVQNEDIV